MKWRCEWCGKPHEANDPPCDSCGHGSFERAVVQVPDYETVDTGREYVWACTECGREHVKNSPPCSRCGNPDLERTEPDYADVDDDLDVPGWLEVARPYAPVLVVLLVVVGLFATGIVPLSVLPGVGTDVPGEGSEAAGIDLESAEGAVHERLQAERRAADAAAERPLDDDLSAFATYQNHRLAVDRYGDGDPDELSGPAGVDATCDASPTGGVLAPLSDAIDAYEEEAALADDVADGLLGSEIGGDVLSGYDAEGIDLHVSSDGRVYVAYVAC